LKNTTTSRDCTETKSYFKHHKWDWNPSWFPKRYGKKTLEKRENERKYIIEVDRFSLGWILKSGTIKLRVKVLFTTHDSNDFAKTTISSLWYAMCYFFLFIYFCFLPDSLVSAWWKYHCNQTKNSSLQCSYAQWSLHFDAGLEPQCKGRSIYRVF